MDQNMDLKTYLARVGFQVGGPTSDLDSKTFPLTVETLAKIQESHICTIPFENLDTVSGIPINLTLSSLYQKIVVQKRGGWCRELNALLSWALKEMGFKVSLLCGRCYAGGRLTDFEHMLPLVELENGDKYLVDVAYGNFKGTCIPFMLKNGLTKEGPAGWHKLEKDDASQEWTMSYRQLDSEENKWSKLYGFNLLGYEISYFTGNCEKYERKDRLSRLLGKNPIVLLRADGGKDLHILVQNRYRFLKNVGSATAQQTVMKEDDLDQTKMERCLANHFGIPNLDLGKIDWERVQRDSKDPMLNMYKMD